jgi:aminocarboxymuconate-semialdehyde decarboxylase
VTVLGLKGAELDTMANGEQWDEPKFLPLFKAAESMGAVLFFHPAAAAQLPDAAHDQVRPLQQPRRHPRRRDRRRDPDLRRFSRRAPISRSVSHTAAAPPATRWGVSIAAGRHAAERRSIPQPPSAYQRRLYYDTVVGSEKALRFLIDEVGVDRVVLGSDWPSCRGIPRRSPGCRGSRR